MKTQKNIASIMVSWTTSCVSETAKASKYFVKFDFGELNILPSEWLNDIGTGVHGYDKTSVISIFPLKKDTKDCQKGHAQSRLYQLSTGSLNFVRSQFSFKCLHFLFWNSFLESLWSFYTFTVKLFFAISPLKFTLSKNCSVSTDAAFPVAMLYNLSLSA